MPETSIDDLFAQTIQGDYDNDSAWQAIHTLQSLATREVFEKAASWCRSNESLKRTRGADILGQLGKSSENAENPFVDESFKALTSMLDSETDPGPLSSVIGALGHLENPSAIPLILPFSYHPDSDVRFDLAFALGCFADDERSVSTLLKLMSDKDSEVRDWATFGLGVLGSFDSPKIREALLQNLTDEDEDVREEAMVALALRKDLRSLPAVMSELEREEPSPRTFDAANALLDRTTYPFDPPATYLEALRQRFPSEN
jgi:HEAT repeat protein